MAAVTTRSASASPNINAAAASSHLNNVAAAPIITAATTSSVTTTASNGGSAISHGPIDASLFPLRSIADVVTFFRRSLETWSPSSTKGDGGGCGPEPDLTLLSIVAGYVELSLTTGEAASAAAAAVEQQQQQQQLNSGSVGGISGCGASAGGSGGMSCGGGGGVNVGLIGAAGLLAGQAPEIIKGNTVPFPIVTHELVSGLYKKFQSILSVVEKPKISQHRQASREIIKKVSDVIWHSLIRSSYKDRAHLQNLYSYLSGNKLDCFGVALAVVAGCQLLGYRDVHLAIAEDHAWVVFDCGGAPGTQRHRCETIEVTWHGKGSEDKRGQDITGGIDAASWLYLSGRAVVCDRGMEVAAIVSAINISLTANSDCVEVAELQQQLLWLLYQRGHLKRYPMALGTLGELEEINPLPSAIERRLTSEQLYREAIVAARDNHANKHVYPYTYLGNYYNRLLRYREAFAAWANAADVIRMYTYNCRDDEEIYKELLDIANELIPHVMKTESSGHSARSILRDSEVFANLLRFYDGICQWEEDSATPIMHIGWAKPLVNNITKFDYDIRSQVVIQLPAADADILSGGRSGSAGVGGAATGRQEQHEANNSKKEALPVVASIDAAAETNNNNSIGNFVSAALLPSGGGKKSTSLATSLVEMPMPTTLADLTAACGEKILNPDFLLQGGSQPFADQKHQQQHNNNSNNNNNNNNDNDNDNINSLVEVQNGGNIVDEKASNDGKTKNNIEETVSEMKEDSLQSNGLISNMTMQDESIIEEDPLAFMLKRPIITLYSQKMMGLKDLLLAEKLNTHAISLQLTAPSVASKKVRGSGEKSGHHHHHYTTNSASFVTPSTTGNVAASNTSVSGVSASSQQSYGATHASATSAATSTSSALADSIAVSRPKRSRRE